MILLGIIRNRSAVENTAARSLHVDTLRQMFNTQVSGVWLMKPQTTVEICLPVITVENGDEVISVSE